MRDSPTNGLIWIPRCEWCLSGLPIVMIGHGESILLDDERRRLRNCAAVPPRLCRFPCSAD
jgi:hypothetical protein